VNTLAERFADLVHIQEPLLPGPALLPERLAVAVVQLLPVDGAGISVLSYPGTRVPVGASDPTSAAAERLQFTVGEGPCLSAYATGRPVFAPSTVYAQQWPVLYQALTTRTPFRSVVSLPLQHEFAGIGALDLHFRSIGLPTDHWADADIVADEITVALNGPPVPIADPNGWPAPADGTDPAWLDSVPARRRYQVWLAMGMVSVHLDIPAPDAFDILRGMAFARGLDVDDLSAQVTTRQVPLVDFPPLER
jgi:hypothetical protein